MKQDLFAVLKLLSSSSKAKLGLLVVAHLFLSILELIGLSLLIVIATSLIAELQGAAMASQITGFYEILGLGGGSFALQMAVIAISVVAIFLAKTILGLVLNRALFFFLSRETSLAGGKLLRKLFSQEFDDINQDQGQKLLYASTAGLENIFMNFLSNIVIVVAESIFLFFVFIGVIAINPLIAGVSLIILGGTLLILQQYLSRRSVKLAGELLNLGVSINQIFLDSLLIYRELFLSKRTSFPIEIADAKRAEQNLIRAQLAFMPNLSKYILEFIVVVASFGILFIEVVNADISRAINTLVLFIALTARLTPTMLRIQNSTLSLKQSRTMIAPTLKLLSTLDAVDLQPTYEPTSEYIDFYGSISLINGMYSFHQNDTIEFQLKNLNLNIEPGEFIAIVGNSGAGKSTLVDILLGLRRLDSGEVLISGVPARDAINRWPGAISIVPQSTILIDGTIEDNITLGAPLDEELMQRILKICELEELINNKKEGLLSRAGERGMRLSGGQRQRIGIARALYTKPTILVMDESTNSLDAELEFSISANIEKLGGETTIVMVAHRLSTVLKADKVVYMENGVIEAVGTFTEVRKQIPKFNVQAMLSGLKEE